MTSASSLDRLQRAMETVLVAPVDPPLGSALRLARAMERLVEPAPMEVRGNPNAVVTLYALRRRDDSDLTVALYASPTAHYMDDVGLLRAHRFEDYWRLDSACDRAVRSLAAEAGVRPSRPYAVIESGLSEAFRRRGLGAWMYAEACRLAWVQDRAPLVADSCTSDGETSLAAGRVWDSASLRLVARVSDRAALWRAGQRSTPAPAGVRIREYPSRG